MIGIPIDVFDCLLSRVYAHGRGAGQLAGAVDDSSFENARAKFAAFIEASDSSRESVEIVCHVAGAGDAVGEIERAVDVAKMLVVVPEPGHEEAALCVYDLRISRWFCFGV